MADKQNVSNDEAAVRDLIEAWRTRSAGETTLESSEAMRPIS